MNIYFTKTKPQDERKFCLTVRLNNYIQFISAFKLQYIREPDRETIFALDVFPYPFFISSRTENHIDSEYLSKPNPNHNPIPNPEPNVTLTLNLALTLTLTLTLTMTICVPVREEMKNEYRKILRADMVSCTGRN